MNRKVLQKEISYSHSVAPIRLYYESMDARGEEENGTENSERQIYPKLNVLKKDFHNIQVICDASWDVRTNLYSAYDVKSEYKTRAHAYARRLETSQTLPQHGASYRHPEVYTNFKKGCFLLSIMRDAWSLFRRR